MATDLARLVVRLEAENSVLHNKLDQSEQRTRKFSQRMSIDIDGIAKRFIGLAAAAGAGLAAMYVVNAQGIDKLAKQADKLGMTTEALQGLRYAGELSGVAIGTTDMALQRMTRRVAEAARGTGEAKDAIKELNLNAAELARMSPDEQFKAIAGAMEGVANQGDKVRLAMKLFDSEGVALVNTLSMGVDGLNAAQQELDAFGVAISRVDAAKVEIANDEFLRARTLMSGFGQSITTGLAPIVAGLAEEFLGVAKEAGGAGKMADKAIDVMVRGAGFAGDAVRGLHIIWSAFVLTIREAVNAQVQFFGMFARLGNWGAKMLGIDSESLQAVVGFFDGYQATTSQMRADLAALVAAPLPSENAEQWITAKRGQFDAEAQATAAGASGSSGNTGGEAGPTEAELAAQLKADAKAQSDLDRLIEQLMSEEERIAESYRRRNEIIDASLERKQISEEKALELRNKVQRDMDLALLQEEHKIAKAKMGLAKSVLDVGIGLAKEGSKAQRVLLGIQKAIAVREAMMDLQVAMAKALKVPWPANIGALAQVASLGAGIIGTLQGVDTAVPSFLGGGFTGYGPRIGGLDGMGGMPAIVHPDESIIDHRQGGGDGLKVAVHLHEDASRAGESSARWDDSDTLRIDATVASLVDRGGGRTTNALEQKYHLKRRGT